VQRKSIILGPKPLEIVPAGTKKSASLPEGKYSVKNPRRIPLTNSRVPAAGEVEEKAAASFLSCQGRGSRRSRKGGWCL